MIKLADFHKISDTLWEIPQSYRPDMQVPARIYANQKMLTSIMAEKAIEQLVNVTTLPGIVKYALAMPDIHQGYGFPIGGVAAMDQKNNGVISPGGIGYDINCGVRLLASSFHVKDIKSSITKLTDQIYRSVPSGVGSSGNISLSHRELDTILNTGVSWAIKKGMALSDDLLYTEENGHYKTANADCVSPTAKERGIDQLGTLGAGNHFLEIQEVSEIYDEAISEVFGFFPGQVTIMIHTGSRGLGHQVCTDYVKLFNSTKLMTNLVDRELAYAPFDSQEGQSYFQAMAAAANFAWTNRQIITDLIRNVWVHIFGGDKEQLRLIYDVAHNIAKIEKYFNKKLIVHRKGATRAFGPKHPELPQKYQTSGQPILIPGSMGSFSYVLAGTHESMQHTFGSTCHGAGRTMSRAKSKKSINLNTLLKNLKQQDIVVNTGSMRGLLEEAPEAYKDINDVVGVVVAENIGKKVAKLKPLGVIKG